MNAISFVLLEYHSIEEVNLYIENLIKNEIFKNFKCEIIISSNSLYDSQLQAEIINTKPSYINWLFNDCIYSSIWLQLTII